MLESPAITEVKRLRSLGAEIGEGTLIFGRVDVSVNYPNFIKIGKCCLIASEAILLSHGYPHNWLPLVVGDNCYVGFRAIVLPGAIIADNCVVGAGAVVPKTLKVAEWSLIVGNPAVLKVLNRDRHKIFVDHMKTFVNA